MAIAQDPSSFDILQEEGLRRASGDRAVQHAADFEAHVQTYRSFLRILGFFVAHVAVILVLMYLFLV